MTEEHQHRSPNRSDDYDMSSFASTSRQHESPSASSAASREHSQAPTSKKPRTTAVWNYYSERVPISETHWEVKCLNCATSYRIKRDGSTGTSTLHKHHKQCSSKMAGQGATPITRLPNGAGSPPPSSRHHHAHSHSQHDYTASPSSQASTSLHALPNSIPAQALQDFLRAAQQQNSQGDHGHHHHLQHHSSVPTSSAASNGGMHALSEDFDVAAAAAAAASAASMTYSDSNGGGTPGEGIDLIVLNPNSSESITLGLRQHLEPLRPSGVRLSYTTGPPSAPPSINDPPTSILSAQASFEALAAMPEGLGSKSGVLVCCFSAHPLVPMIRHHWPELPCMHILDAAVNHAMSCGASSFGILTTGRAMVPDIDAGVLSYMGGVSQRYKGCIATDIGVLELGDPAMRGQVEKRIKQEAGRLALEKGAEAIILGCAGMAGMEALVHQGVVEAGGSSARTWVIDGAKAGVQLLAGLARCRYRAE